MAPVSPVAVPDLPAEVQKILDEFLLSVKEAFSNQLKNITRFTEPSEGKVVLPTFDSGNNPLG